MGIESRLNGVPVTRPAIGAAVTAQRAILRILGEPQRFHLSCLNGVILVRDKTQVAPAWLSRKIPSFRINRETLKVASMHLGMQVKAMLDPHMGGYAGSILDRVSPDLVGPYDIKGATARSILCLLARASKGAVWVVPSTSESFVDSVSVDPLFMVIVSPKNL